jgi:hypothetical protein
MRPRTHLIGILLLLLQVAVVSPWSVAEGYGGQPLTHSDCPTMSQEWVSQESSLPCDGCAGMDCAGGDCSIATSIPALPSSAPIALRYLTTAPFHRPSLSSPASRSEAPLHPPPIRR